jgi:dTDP-4-dehydrorhamnose reductase
MTSFDILVIGGSGFVGSKLVEVALRNGLNTSYTYLNKPLKLPATAFQLQVQDWKSLEACITETQPLCIVYCAVPPPNREDYLHEVVNVQSVVKVCALLKNMDNSRLIYISTNAIFSGQEGPYKENDIPDPDKRHDQYRAYALTKARGEQVALASWDNTIVARTSDVNGKDEAGRLNPRLANLAAELRAGNRVERSKIAFISPTLVDHLAEALLEISRPDFSYRGILHLAGREQISYFDFACRIAEKIHADPKLIQPEFSRIWNIGLDTTYSQSILRTPFPNVEEQLLTIFS